VSRTTIDKRLVFLAKQARRRNAAFLEQYPRLNGPIKKLQFDDLITTEHTKYKPVSVAAVVHEKTRIVIEYSVAQIPAFDDLAAVSHKKCFGMFRDKMSHLTRQSWNL